MTIIFIKLAIALVLTLFYLTAFFHNPFQSFHLTGSRALLLCWLSFRLVPFFALYLVGHLVAPSDVIAFFWPQAISASQGLVVYRDFASHYSPLFPYVLGLVVRLWPDPRALVFFMILVEGLTLALTAGAFRKFFDKSDSALAVLLYLLSPASFILVVLGGQEDLWLWTFGVLVLGCLVREKPLQAGVWAAIGLAATKILFILPLIAFFFSARKRYGYGLGFLLIAIILFLPFFVLAGTGILMPLQESSQISPPNVWFLVNAFLNGPGPLGWPLLGSLALGAVAIVAGIFFWRYRANIHSSVRGYAIGWIFLFSLFMFLSPKSLGNYVAIFLMPLTFITVLYRDRLAMWLTVFLNLLSSVQPSLWYRLGSPLHTGFSFLKNMPELLEVGMEIVMVAIFCALMLRSLQWISSNTTVQTSSLAVAWPVDDLILG